MGQRPISLLEIDLRRGHADERGIARHARGGRAATRRKSPECPESAEASTLLAEVFSDGLRFLRGDPGQQWLASDHKLEQVASEAHRDGFARLAGGLRDDGSAVAPVARRGARDARRRAARDAFGCPLPLASRARAGGSDVRSPGGRGGGPRHLRGHRPDHAPARARRDAPPPRRAPRRRLRRGADRRRGEARGRTPHGATARQRCEARGGRAPRRIARRHTATKHGGRASAPIGRCSIGTRPQSTGRQTSTRPSTAPAASGGAAGPP